jgi:CHASE3 domain sensor protein
VTTQPTHAPPSGLRALERNVLLGFGVAAIVLLLIAVFSYVNLVRFRTDAKLVAHTHEVLNTLSELLSDLTAAESSQRGFLISGNSEYQQTYNSAAENIARQLSALAEFTRDNPVQQMNLKPWLR